MDNLMNVLNKNLPFLDIPLKKQLYLYYKTSYKFYGDIELANL